MAVEGLSGDHGPYFHAILKWASTDVIKFCNSALLMLELFLHSLEINGYHLTPC